MNVIRSEPTIFYTAVAAIIGLAVAFGAPISTEQRDAILYCVTALIPLALIIRQSVFAPDTVEREVVQAAETGVVPQAIKPPEGTVGR